QTGSRISDSKLSVVCLFSIIYVLDFRIQKSFSLLKAKNLLVGTYQTGIVPTKSRLGLRISSSKHISVALINLLFKPAVLIHQK
ncbi:hypothetical protein KJ925_05425, partial [Patescibacteria group bacterium]|nr:hypothetical protein [Patescibacteria group bacterium]